MAEVRRVSNKEGKTSAPRGIWQQLARSSVLLLGVAAWGVIIFLMRDLDSIHGPSATRAEVRVLSEMRLYCADSIALGRLAEAKAIHEELRQFGGERVASYSQEVARLDTLLRERHGRIYRGNARDGQDPALARLSDLNGAAFEAAFLEEALHRNARALQHIERHRQRIGDAVLQYLRERLSAELHAERKRLEGWRSRWYGSPPTVMP
jgi:hypothetical protein